MLFGDIIGHSKIKSQLTQLVKNDRVPHAIMLAGKEGVGALSIALAFSQYMLCDNINESDACGVCPSCNRVSKLIHPDVHFAYPVVAVQGKKRKDVTSQDFITAWRSLVLEQPYFGYNHWVEHIDAQKGQADINARECLEIIKKLSLTSYAGKKKILIMWLPEYLGTNGNRLLKLIEEPPEETIIIFVTQNTDAVLNTILSRFQIMAVPPIDTASMTAYLVEHRGLDRELASKIADQSHGSMTRIGTVLENTEDDLHDQIIGWLRICYTSRPEDLVQWVDNFAKSNKEFQKYFLSNSLYIFREILVTKNRLAYTSVIQGKITNLANIMTLSNIDKISNVVSESIMLLERNINVKIMMMANSLNIGQAMRKS